MGDVNSSSPSVMAGSVGQVDKNQCRGKTSGEDVLV